MAVICGKLYDAVRVEWRGSESSVEASNLAPLRDGGPFGQVYDDACDTGCVFVNQETGTEAVFAVFHVESNNEGELLYWDLVPIPETIRKHSQLRNVRVRVFND